MGVVPGGPRALTEIESHLAKSDPALAAKFAAFAADPSRARQFMREPERHPRARNPAPSQAQPATRNPAPNRAQPARARRVTMLIVLAIMLVTCIMTAALTAS